MSHYNQNPTIKVNGRSIAVGTSKIVDKINTYLTKDNSVVAFECYPGVNEEKVLELAKGISPEIIIHTFDFLKDESTLNEQFKYNLTNDRVFGKMYYGDVEDLIDDNSLQIVRNSIEKTVGVKVIYGLGASLVTNADIVVYFDISRWEIQRRYRNGMPNYRCTNYNEDILIKFKRGYFIEWRIADKLKLRLKNDIDFYVDCNNDDELKMISWETLDFCLKSTVNRPFRTVPYFDPGVWGGQWMKEKFGLDKSKVNYAWAFDGVPEENSLIYEISDEFLEIPSMNLILFYPRDLLGDIVYYRFGAEFPIRFDFLDTMNGQNLSLQVHPLVDYIKREFGMSYTQDESYYILDSKKDAVVYLGLKENINAEEVKESLKRAENGNETFNVDKYINAFPAKKHDHFLIPAGTIHCSGTNAMVLEISATPYIFTFKLWDWSRNGLDGKPRPVHLEHGSKVIQWDRRTTWVANQLVNRIELLYEDEDYKEERTGLHAFEFIETRRYWIKKNITIDTENNFNMLNLVEGIEALVTSIDSSFEPFHINYAETFIVPACVKSYTIEPYGESLGQEIAIIRAFVRKSV